MNKQTRDLEGSKKRDKFKLAHKKKMDNAAFYASDCDLCIVCDKPRGVVAYFDYKGSGEDVTYSEHILYDEWMQTKPVFILEGPDPENGPFDVKKYHTDKEPEFVCKLKDWNDFLKWEAGLRREYTKSHADLLRVSGKGVE